MTKQRISIIIPCLNEERYLAACLDSIAVQTVPPDEVIVVDNGSTDASVAIVRRYPFVTVMHESHRGIVHARNAGFNAAHGDILARTDADVVLPPDWVERVAAFYADPAHARQGLTGNGRPNNLPLSRVLGWLQGQIAFRVNRLLLGHYIFFGSNMAFPAEIWRHVHAQTCDRTDIHEDLDLAIHVHRAGYTIAYRETLQVEGRIARIVTDYRLLLPNLLLWPRTLRVHGLWTWVFGWLGAYALYVLSPSLVLLGWLGKLFGRSRPPAS